MKKGIIIHDNSELRKLLSLNMAIYTDVELISLPDANAAMDYLKKEPDIALIVTKNEMKDENTVLKTFYYINSNKLDIPLICLGQCFKLGAESNVYIAEDYEKKIVPIVKMAAKMMGVTAEKMAELEVEENFPIPIRQLTLMDRTPVTLYQKDDEGKVSTLFEKGSTIDKGYVREMLFNKVKEVYVNKFDRVKLVNAFTEQASAKVASYDTKNKDRVSASMALFDNSMQLISKTGMTPEAQKAAKGAIEGMLQTINATNEMAELLNILEELEGGYLYKHSMLLALLTHSVLSELDFATKKQKELVCFVSYFHDVMLADDDLAKIHSEEDLKDANLSAEQEKKVRNHAFQAAQFLGDFPETPYGAIEVVTQHHGQLNGIGFAPEESSKISPVACVFIVVENYVDLILRSQENEDIDFKKEATTLLGGYKKGFYKQAASVLSQMKTKL